MSRSVGAKVAVLGAAGGIGQCLSLLLKLSPEIDEVACYDVVNSPGVAADLSHIPTSAKVTGYLPSPLSWPPSGNTGLSSALSKADLVVIPAGVPRKPGMSLDDLISTNAGIVKSVTENIVKHSPNTIIIVVSNPLDVMTYQAHLVSAFPRTRVMGMAGILDTARYRAFLAEALNVSPKDIQAMLLGGHGDTMVPLPRYTTVAGIPVTELMGAGELNAIIERTKVGGGELVKLMGTSAWYAPGSAAAQMVEAIVKNQRRVLPVCIKLEGEYGIDNCYLGVPAILGKNGVERVIELDLNAAEKTLLDTSRQHVKEVMDVLDNLPK